MIEKNEIYHSVLPTLFLVWCILYVGFIFEPHVSSHAPTGGITVAAIYLVLVVVITVISAALYMSWIKDIFWLTKAINTLILVLGGSIGSLMLAVYSIELMREFAK